MGRDKSRREYGFKHIPIKVPGSRSPFPSFTLLYLVPRAQIASKIGALIPEALHCVFAARRQGNVHEVQPRTARGRLCEGEDDSAAGTRRARRDVAVVETRGRNGCSGQELDTERLDQGGIE